MYLFIFRGGSRTAATSKMERFVIIVNGFQPLTIITKRSILGVAAVLDPPLIFDQYWFLNCISQEDVNRNAPEFRSLPSPERKYVVTSQFLERHFLP